MKWIVRLALVSICGLASLYARSQQPDLPSVNAPSPEPTFPAGWDVFSPPVSAITPASTAPAISEFNRTVDAGHSLTLSAENLSTGTVGTPAEGEDTQLFVYGQTSSTNGVLLPAAIQRLDGQKAILTLDSSLPTWSAYLLWAENANGTSYPVVLNQTDGWWIGPNYGTAGDTVSVYGRNLSNQNGTTTSWVYIKPVGDYSGTWATVTNVNPYKVDFTVPNLSNGTYEVWIHNGHGGNYGWSGPLTFTVASPYTWSSTTFNVTSYGATGDGSTDDTAAIQSALSASAVSPGSTVYFPAGTYVVSSSLTASGNQLWLGDGPTSSVLKLSGSVAELITSSNKSNIEFQNLGADASAGTISGNGVIQLTNASYVTFNAVQINAGSSAQTLWLNNGAYLTIASSTFIGKSMFLNHRTQTFIHDSAFQGMGNTGEMVNPWQWDGFAFYSNTYQDYSSTQAAERFLACNENQGSDYNGYFANNTTTATGPLSTDSNQNSGEQFLWQGSWVMEDTTPTSATSTTVTFASIASAVTSNASYLLATVHNGTGMGQTRRVTAVDSSTGVVTVAPAWNVVPDTTSTISLGALVDGIVFYQNTLDGKHDYASRITASTGLEFYEGAANAVLDGNTMTNVRSGFFPWSRWHGATTAASNDSGFSYFGIYKNNNVNGAWYGIMTLQQQTGVVGLLGNIYSNNTTSATAAASFSNQFKNGTSNSNVLTSVDMEGSLLEGNTFNNTPVGLILSTAEDIALSNNQISLGTGTSSGSMGFDLLSSGTVPTLRNNAWTGFSTTYAGSTPGGVIEVPYRTLQMAASAYGSPVTATTTLWNSGTATMSWTASSDSTWLTLSVTSGTAVVETGLSNVTVTADPSSLTSGTYTGHITVSDGTRSKVIGVTFTVS